MADVRIVDMTAEPAAAWDELALRSPHGSALQSHAWGEFKRRTGWTPLRYRIDADGEPVAVVSFQERALLGRRLRAVPLRILYAPTGPVLLGDESAALPALHGVVQAARQRRAGLVIVDPEWKVGSPVAETLRSAAFRPRARQIQVSRTGMFVPVDADEADQRRRLNENTRRNITRAQKAGVEVVRYDADSTTDELGAALDDAYDMLAETGRKRGFGIALRARSYHTAASRTLILARAASLWFARHEGKPVAHTLVHHSGRRLVLFQAGEGESGGTRISANFLLQWTILRWAATAGFDVYDLGGVDTHAAPGLPRDESHPLWSLYRFKSQWGAEPVEFVGAQQYAPGGLTGMATRTALRLGELVRGGGAAG